MTLEAGAPAPDDACAPITAENCDEQLAEAVRLGTRIEHILRALLAFAEQSENQESAQ